MQVKRSGSGIALENILLVIGSGREFLEPFMGDADLALGRAGFDLLEAVGSWVDEAGVDEGLEEGLAGETDDFALLAVGIDGGELDDAVGDLGGGGESGGD